MRLDEDGKGGKQDRTGNNVVPRLTEPHRDASSSPIRLRRLSRGINAGHVVQALAGPGHGFSGLPQFSLASRVCSQSR